jgi:two-component system, chemotaxis family, protein-glutamate methylesterase/glutaminase
VVIGASAGAVEALGRVLPALPSNFPAPVVVVVHMPADRDSALVELFRSKCRMNVKEAEDKEPMEPGTIYFAPPDYHVLIENGNRLSLSNDEPVHFSRPSIDVLFESAAAADENVVLGIVLSGGSEDGSQGLRAISESGGGAWVQDPMEAEAKLMPRTALVACPSASKLNLSEMQSRLKEFAA